MPRFHSPVIDRDTSLAIRIARPLCIFFMIAVHFTPSDHEILAAQTWAPLQAFYTLWLDYLGRGSVPLLSLVSGVLLAATYHAGRKSGAETIAAKFRKLIVPMALWSAVLLGLFAARAVLTGNAGPMPDNRPMSWINAVFGITAQPINLPLGFLRDLFVSSVLGLGVLSVHRRQAGIGIGLMIAVPVVVHLWLPLVVLRPLIIEFMFGGLLLAALGLTNVRVGWGFVCGALIVLVGLDFLHARYDGAAMADLVLYWKRIAMSLFMWKCALVLASRDTALRHVLLWSGPVVYLVFLSHRVTITALSVMAEVIGMTPDSPAFIVFFLFQYVVVIVAAYGLSRVLGRLFARKATPGAPA